MKFKGLSKKNDTSHVILPKEFDRVLELLSSNQISKDILIDVLCILCNDLGGCDASVCAFDLSGDCVVVASTLNYEEQYEYIRTEINKVCSQYFMTKDLRDLMRIPDAMDKRSGVAEVEILPLSTGTEVYGIVVFEKQGDCKDISDYKAFLNIISLMVRNYMLAIEGERLLSMDSMTGLLDREWFIKKCLGLKKDSPYCVVVIGVDIFSSLDDYTKIKYVIRDLVRFLKNENLDVYSVGEGRLAFVLNKDKIDTSSYVNSIKERLLDYSPELPIGIVFSPVEDSFNETLFNCELRCRKIKNNDVSLVRVVECDEDSGLSMFDSEIFSAAEQVPTEKEQKKSTDSKPTKARKKAKDNKKTTESSLDIKVSILEGEWFD